MSFKHTASGFLKAALLLGFVVIGSIFASPAQAQEKASNDPKADYKTSLDSLSTLYKSEVERLEKKQQQSKELFQDGLISRLEFENGEKELADARAKVEQTAKEIATANQPTPEIALNALSDISGSNQAWSS